MLPKIIFIYCFFIKRINLNVFDKFEEKKDYDKTIKFTEDDKLDAFIACLLGYLWVNYENQIILLGNQMTGTLLLPCYEILENLIWFYFNYYFLQSF